MSDAPDLDAELHAAVTERFETAQIPYLQALVDRPSHTYAREDVEQAACLLDERAGELGLTVERVPDPEGRFADHRVFRTPGLSDDGRGLALVGHVDTVFPRRLGFLRFEREDDVARGPGVLDMKSGLTSILFALDALRRVAPEAFAELKARVVVVSDEEVGSPSSKPLFARLAPFTREALVFEAGREADRIVVARRGTAVYTVSAQGNAAHAGLFHAEGVNAIHALACVIPAIEALTDYERGVTFNVGLVEGGSARNTVPDHAECTVDVRYDRAADAEWVDRSLRRLVASPNLSPRLHAAKIGLAGGVYRPAMQPGDATHALRAAYEAHAEAVGLSTGAAPLQGGASDANLLADLGVPVIDGLGPYGRNFHRTDEWCSLDSLRRRTQALASFLYRRAG